MSSNSTSTPEPVEDPAFAPEPANISHTPIDYSQCTDNDGFVDSHGTNCSKWYNENPETCGNYDTNEFIAVNLCCACKWEVLSEDATEFTMAEWNKAMSNFAIIFTKHECTYCHHAINYLSSLGYASYVIDTDLISNQSPQYLEQL